MSKVKCPCKYCTKSTGRYPGCHDHCKKPEYLKWKDQELERKKQQDQERLFRIAYQETKSRIIAQTKRRVRMR